MNKKLKENICLSIIIFIIAFMSNFIWFWFKTGDPTVNFFYGLSLSLFVGVCSFVYEQIFRK